MSTTTVSPTPGSGSGAAMPHAVPPTTRRHLLGTYAPPELRFVSGEGSTLIADDGRRFLDFTSGIGVNALGFDAPEIRGAILESLDTGLVHTSNLFRTAPAEALATELATAAFPSQLFFCNSGAEAGEAAIKFARRIVRAGGTGADDPSGARTSGIGPEPPPESGDAGGGASPHGRHEIVAFRRGFHGRLHGTLAITDRPAAQAPFHPLMPGARIVELTDWAEVEAAVDPLRTAAVVVEPVMGEGGVTPIPDGTLRALRELCDRTGTLLIFDEVQCGLGRTGELFAWQASGVVPDLLTLAKPLAGGLPMGAVLVHDRWADRIRPGDHATTFGGGPLVATVALAVLRTVSEPAFLARVRAAGDRLSAGLHALVAAHDGALCAHGRGLMWGLSVTRPAAEIAAEAREHGVLLVGAGPDVVRFLPPLIVRDEEIDRVVELVGELL